MAVRQEGWGWIVDFVFTHVDGRKERIRKKAPVQTKRAAEQFERMLRQELLDPTPVRKEIPRFAEYAEEVLMQYAVTNNKVTEQQGKRSTLDRHLIPAFGRLTLDQINRRNIEAYKARKVKEGYAPKTINNHLTVLRKTLALAVEDELLDHVPPIKWMKVPLPEFDFFNFDEAGRLLEAARSEPLWRTMFLTALRTGLRQGELLALRWDDVDLVAGRLVVKRRDWRGDIDTPKSGKPREVPLSPGLQAALKAYRHLKGELVFSKPDGDRLTHGQLKWPLWSFCSLAGLRRIGWHVLRHTFCSHLVMRGVPLKVVQEYAGHSDIRITMRYSHLSPEVGQASVALLDGEKDADRRGSNVAVAPKTGGSTRRNVLSLQNK